MPHSAVCMSTRTRPGGICQHSGLSEHNLDRSWRGHSSRAARAILGAQPSTPPLLPWRAIHSGHQLLPDPFLVGCRVPGALVCALALLAFPISLGLGLSRPSTGTHQFTCLFSDPPTQSREKEHPCRTPPPSAPGSSPPQEEGLVGVSSFSFHHFVLHFVPFLS